MPDFNPCNVTMKAGPGASKGYESFVGNSLKGELLQEITSNLDEDLKDEALAAFCDSVTAGYPIKECIAKVQNDVLVKVPNVRNKFNIKFVYDNQLMIEIGVNKFSNGNAQFYHKLGVAPKETPEQKKFKVECNKRRNVLQDVKQSGGFRNIRLKPQVTVDKSAPVMGSKVSLPEGGWGDAPEFEEYQPNPTNKQTVRVREGFIPTLAPSAEGNTSQSRQSRPRQLGDLFRNKKPQHMTKLRTKSVGRPAMPAVDEEEKKEIRERTERSISPTGSKYGKGRGALGDVFLSGIRPSQNRLYRTPEVAKAKPYRSGRDWSLDEVESDAEERRRRISGSSMGGRNRSRMSSGDNSGEEGSQQFRGSRDELNYRPSSRGPNPNLPLDEESGEGLQKQVRPPGWMDGRRKQDPTGWKSHKINVQLCQEYIPPSPKGPRVHIMEMSASKPSSFDESDTEEPYVTYDDDEDSFHEPVQSQPFQPSHSPVRAHTIRSPSPVQKLKLKIENPNKPTQSPQTHTSDSDSIGIHQIPIQSSTKNGIPQSTAYSDIIGNQQHNHELPAHQLSQPVKVLPHHCSQPVTIQQEPLYRETVTIHQSPIPSHTMINVNHNNHSEPVQRSGWVSIPIQRIA